MSIMDQINQNTIPCSEIRGAIAVGFLTRFSEDRSEDPGRIREEMDKVSQIKDEDLLAYIIFLASHKPDNVWFNR